MYVYIYIYIYSYILVCVCVYIYIYDYLVIKITSGCFKDLFIYLTSKLMRCFHLKLHK
jgi:hypothetical protein